MSNRKAKLRTPVTYTYHCDRHPTMAVVPDPKLADVYRCALCGQGAYPIHERPWVK